MKRIIHLLTIAAIILCFIINNNTNAQNKRTYISIHAGLFIPGNDYVIGGYKERNYDAGGSPVGFSVSGFGNGGNLNLSIYHYFSNIGIRLKSGVIILRQDEDLALAPDGNRYTLDKTLDIVPVELSLAYKIDLENSKVIPYSGAGVGFYYGSWEHKWMPPEDDQRSWLKGSAFSWGVACYSGIFIPIYYNLLLNLDVAYHVALASWELEDQYDKTVIKYEGLNTGGISFNIGLAFRF